MNSDAAETCIRCSVHVRVCSLHLLSVSLITKEPASRASKDHASRAWPMQVLKERLVKVYTMHERQRPKHTERNNLNKIMIVHKANKLRKLPVIFTDNKIIWFIEQAEYYRWGISKKGLVGCKSRRVWRKLRNRESRANKKTVRRLLSRLLCAEAQF